MKPVIALLLLALSSGVVFPQQSKAEEKVILFAVLNAGGTLEPIAFLKDGEFKDSIDGAQEPDVLKAFHERYFKPKTAYQLVFGGANAGTVTVKSSDPNSECERHTAHAIVSSTRAKMSATVMGLAVSPAFKVEGSGTRRAATALEKTEIESLVREEFAKNKVSGAALKKLRSRNLTAVDVNLRIELAVAADGGGRDLEGVGAALGDGEGVGSGDR